MNIFYFLSKLLPLLFLPIGFLFLICIFWKFHKSKVLFLFGGIIFFLSSIGITSDNLWRIIEYPYKSLEISGLPSSNAIVVLSGGHPTRLLGGVKLFKSKKAQNIIFTRGHRTFLNSKIYEGDLNKNEAIDLGIPKISIIVTKSVKNTIEEAKAVEEIFTQKNLNKEIILVTSAFHMKRAKRLFERKGFSVNPFPVDFKSESSSNYKNPYKWFPNASSINSSSIVLRELIGRFIYKTF